MTTNLNLAVLVDDEATLTKIMQRHLARIAPELEVRTFNDPRVALAEIESRGLKPGIICSDYKMPGMNGEELLSKVETHVPGAYRILCSGSHTPQDCREGLVHHGLSKPYNQADLMAMLEAYGIYNSK